MTLTTGSLNVLQLYTARQHGGELPDDHDRRARRLARPQVGVAGGGRHGWPDPDRGRPVQRRQHSAAIQTQVETVAKQADPRSSLANTTIGGKSVTTATYPNTHTGPLVAYITGDTLYLLQSSNPALVEDALKQLP